MKKIKILDAPIMDGAYLGIGICDEECKITAPQHCTFADSGSGDYCIFWQTGAVELISSYAKDYEKENGKEIRHATDDIMKLK